MKTIDKLFSSFYKFQRIFLLIVASAMTLINVLQIAGRYIFTYSLTWSEQTSLALFFWIIVLAANVSAKTDSELKIDILEFKSEKANLILGIIRDIFAFITLCFLIRSSFVLVQQTAKFPRYISSLKLSYNIMYIPMFVGFILLALDKLLVFCHRITSLSQLNSKKKEEC